MSPVSSDDKQKLFEILKKRSFFKEKIILSSGKESDYYIDARRATLTSDGAYYGAKLILDSLDGEKVDAIGGPTLGADPLVGAIAVLSHQAGKPLNTFIIRKAPKAHGKQQQVEGPDLSSGMQVIIIDDVATTGKAFVQSIEVLEKMGVKVKKAVCLVDRGEGAKEALAKLNCPLVSFFTAQDFLR